MAKRIPNACDNVQHLDKMTKRVDTDTNEVTTATCDEVTHQKLDIIAANLGDVAETKVAGETLSAIKAVKLDNPTDVSCATSNTTCPDATVYGITRTGAASGANVEVITSGNLYDSSLNFPVNESLYLGVNGAITNVAPTTGFVTQIGTSGGPGLMIVNIDQPIELAP